MNLVSVILIQAKNLLESCKMKSTHKVKDFVAFKVV